MEIVTKTGEALSGLWLSFDVQEKLITMYAGVFVVLLVLGSRAEAKRKREWAQLRDEIVEGVARVVR